MKRISTLSIRVLTVHAKHPVKIPESDKKIRDDAFRNCTKLTIIETPGALSELNDYVFYNCGALETVKINEGTKTIHEKAFIGASIKKLFIPASFGGFDKYGYINAQIIGFASDDNPDKNREGNLLVSRKIILKGNMSDRNKIILDDDEAIELPFHMIPIKDFLPDEEQIGLLRRLLPEDESVFSLLKRQHKKAKRKEHEGIIDKSFSVQDLEKIKEWLES